MQRIRSFRGSHEENWTPSFTALRLIEAAGMSGKRFVYIRRSGVDPHRHYVGITRIHGTRWPQSTPRMLFGRCCSNYPPAAKTDYPFQFVDHLFSNP